MKVDFSFQKIFTMTKFLLKVKRKLSGDLFVSILNGEKRKNNAIVDIDFQEDLFFHFHQGPRKKIYFVLIYKKLSTNLGKLAQKG